MRDKLPRGGELLLVDNGVDSDVDAGPKPVGMGAERGDVGQRIAGGGPRTKVFGTDVDGVGPVVDGGQAAGQVPGRSQEFEFAHSEKGGRSTRAGGRTAPARQRRGSVQQSARPRADGYSISLML